MPKQSKGNEMKLKDGLEISSSEFWYDLTKGGYLNPEEMIEDPEIAAKVRDAVKLIKEFEYACKEQIDGFEM